MEQETVREDYLEHRKRVKQNFLKSGLAGLSPKRALELILFFALPRKDTEPIAAKLLERFGSFDKVLDAGLSELTEVDGVGEHTAVLILLLRESFRYYESEKRKKGLLAVSTDDAKRYVRSLFAGEKDEVFYLLCFDNRLRLQVPAKISEGSGTSLALTVRRVVERAALHKAESVLLAHNHPDGYAVPSAEDLAATEQITRALALIGVRVNDHLIAAGDEVLSFAEAGLMSSQEQEEG